MRRPSCPTPTTSPSDRSIELTIALHAFTCADQELTQFALEGSKIQAQLRPASPVNLLKQPGPILIEIADKADEIGLIWLAGGVQGLSGDAFGTLPGDF